MERAGGRRGGFGGLLVRRWEVGGCLHPAVPLPAKGKRHIREALAQARVRRVYGWVVCVLKFLRPRFHLISEAVMTNSAKTN